MTLVTPVYGFPYPENTDSPNGPTQIDALALGVEAQLVRMDKIPLLSGLVFTANGTITAAQASGAKAIRIWGCNGGGGSGGVATTVGSQSAHSGPGAGGATAWRTISTTGLTYPLQVNVGAGGAAGAAGNNGGGVGGQSSVIDNNGAGSTLWTPGAQNGNQAGAGGPASGTVGDASTPGYQGFTSGAVADVVAQGQPGNVPTRVAASVCTRQFGGGSALGAGGVPGNGTSGGTGGVYGGGGGGSYIGASTGQLAGAVGAPGIVVAELIY